MHTSKVLLWVLVIVLVSSSVVQCQRPRPGRRRPALRDSMLGGMISSTLNGAREVIGNIGRGMLRTMDPGPARGPGRGGRRPQRQNFAKDDDDYYYDDYDNFEDTNFNNYDYISSGEFSTALPREPIPAPPNLPLRNKNRIRIRNKFGNNPRGRFDRQDSSDTSTGTRQFNRQQIINDLIQRSGLNGPFYPYPAYIGKKK